jgi:hypothetical protein
VPIGTYAASTNFHQPRDTTLAGYSAKTANEAGARLLRHPRVRAELQERAAAMIEAGTDRAAQLLEEAQALGGDARRLGLMQALTALGRLAKLQGLGNYGPPRSAGRPRL